MSCDSTELTYELKLIIARIMKNVRISLLVFVLFLIVLSCDNANNTNSDNGKKSELPDMDEKKFNMSLVAERDTNFTINLCL